MADSDIPAGRTAKRDQIEADELASAAHVAKCVARYMKELRAQGEKNEETIYTPASEWQSNRMGSGEAW